MKKILKTILKIILIGTVITYIGYMWSFETYSGDESWGPYLCFVIVAGIVILADKMDKK